jgi:amino acid adenylation domain-containing protein
MKTPATPTDFFQGCSRIERIVERVARAHPDRPALREGDAVLSYADLDRRAGLLARDLLGLAPDATFIGLSTTRSIGMVVGLLAILKAGKAYLPIDPAFPAARIQQLVADAGLTACLAPAAEQGFFDQQGLLTRSSDDVSEAAVPTDESVPHATTDLVCVLYTSGSSGRPKGVCLRHAGMINLMQWQAAHSPLGPGHHALQFSHLSFDASFQEIFFPLLTGGTLHLLSEAERIDAEALLTFLVDRSIHRAYLPYVVLQYLAEAAQAAGTYPATLAEVIAGGEAIRVTPAIAHFFEALPACTFINAYGPTEASIWVTENRLRGDALGWPPLLPIGRPIAGLDVFVLDESLRPVPTGTPGELFLGGVCLAEGYLHQPELTAEKFITWTHPERGPMRLYRTGDLGRYLADGTLEFQGRQDGQVKIRGNRVELGELEAVLNAHPGIRQAVVTAPADPTGTRRLLAYVMAGEPVPARDALREAIATRLPDYMMPAAFVFVTEWPRTTSGKIDRKALPLPEGARPDLQTPYRPPVRPEERHITAFWAELLQLDRVGTDDNFFELGGNSLLAQKTIAGLKARFGYALPITRLYQYPTAGRLASYLSGTHAPAADSPPAEPTRADASRDIAVIGLGGRFPGAPTVAALWELLRTGQETTSFFAPDELDPAVPAALRSHPQYVGARGVLADVEQFDPAFFGISPRLAELMDPQQRAFLEIAYETLEQSGYLPAHYAGRVGVFAGSGPNTYYLRNVLDHPERIEQQGDVQVLTVTEKDYLATRTAYHLNLRGPAVNVQSACSTSLLAIAQAVESLRAGQCDAALAGGVSVTVPGRSGHVYQEGAMLSRDGHCRSFDAGGTGTVFSDGAGVVLLKPLDAARRDGDVIYAVIKGIGLNNDGGGKGSFTAPDAAGQAGAIRQALRDGGVDPATISYVEAHGTATPLGDPIEIEGLTQAFGPNVPRQYCALGSVKSNFGHLTAAAGVAGLIKTVLALHHRQLPASLHFERPNPAIDFAQSPFFVNTALRDWTADGPRRAGVSSFGVGGTNVHVVLEEHESAPVRPSSRSAPYLLTWSARSAASAAAYADRLAGYLRQTPDVALADVARTLATTRAEYAHRRALVASSVPDALAQLETSPSTDELRERPGHVVFLFPGQGAQYLQMGRALYDHEPAYRTALDACAEGLRPYLDADLRSVIFPDTADEAATARLTDTRYTQPALFATEYALAQLWMSWGIEPTILCGHSIGEFVAAHLAGVFSLDDALRLIATRGRLVSEQPRGSMLTVRLPAAEVEALLPETLSIAAINSHRLCVVAGPDEAVTAFAATLEAAGTPHRRLQTSHAFHSAMMDPIVPAFRQVAETVSLHRPRRPVVSSVTGRYLTDAQATDPQYWAAHLRQPVRFAEALDTILAEPSPLILEVGPGTALATLARQQAGTRPVPVLSSLGSAAPETEYTTLLGTLGQLWQRGLTPRWAAVFAPVPGPRLDLPAYAFDRRRCWLEPRRGAAVESPDSRSAFHTPTPQSEPNPFMRKPVLHAKLRDILEDASGIELAGVRPDQSFLEMGLDSLLLTQVAQTLRKEFGLPFTFRQLMSTYRTPDQLVAYLDAELPAEAFRPEPQPVAAPAPTPVAASGAASPVPAQAVPNGTALPGSEAAMTLIAQQLELLSRQVLLLQGMTPAAAPVPVAPTIQPAPVAAAPAPVPVRGTPSLSELSAEEQAELKKPFGATARIERQATGLTAQQQAFLEALIARYTARTGASKTYTQTHRPHMADPRVVTGFKPLTKEIVYPIVVNKSKGSRLWDLDGNEYIDALNGFGSILYGYQPDWLKEVLHDQIERGYEIGPQHELAGELTQLLCEFTGFDRAALCNTGSEAVLGAMRIARTITGRSLIVSFAGSYHGINDEVIIRGTKKRKSFPAASGILSDAVQNMLVLDYGTDEALEILRQRAHEIAAVLVEPVQSRRPEFQPVEFLKQVRQITEQSGTVLVFDEVITGFRMHPGGAQALFGIRADLATYGKVVGAGLPIGVIAGKRAYMDALDGGHWQYGDDSVPEVGVTYFAGTFVRHPLALAAARASLTYLKAQGPALQRGISAKAERLAQTLNARFTQLGLPFFIAQFGSLWKLKYTEEQPYGELIFALLREKGLHIWDGFPCFMTEAHTEADIDRMAALFEESIQELIGGGFLHPTAAAAAAPVPAHDAPPVPGARLGRDRQGNPAWFVANPDQPGKYLQVVVK